MLFSESLLAGAGCTSASRLSFTADIDQECTGLVLGAVEETGERFMKCEKKIVENVLLR